VVSGLLWMRFKRDIDFMGVVLRFEELIGRLDLLYDPYVVFY
jgi:hypothetical protein